MPQLDTAYTFKDGRIVEPDLYLQTFSEAPTQVGDDDLHPQTLREAVRKCAEKEKAKRPFRLRLIDVLTLHEGASDDSILEVVTALVGDATNPH